MVIGRRAAPAQPLTSYSTARTAPSTAVCPVHLTTLRPAAGRVEARLVDVSKKCFNAPAMYPKLARRPEDYASASSKSVAVAPRAAGRRDRPRQLRIATRRPGRFEERVPVGDGVWCRP